MEELKPETLDPGQFLTRLNGDLYAILKHIGSPMLTTAFYLTADWRAGTMRYANAGHPKPLLVRRDAGTVESLLNASGKGQTALGLMPEVSYRTSEVALHPNDLVMLFTDGLYEVENRQGDLYSQGLLLAAVRQRLELSAATLFDQVLEEVTGFSAGAGFTDDVCIVGMEVVPEG